MNDADVPGGEKQTITTLGAVVVIICSFTVITRFGPAAFQEE